GYTSDPAGTTVPELNAIATQNMDEFPPTLNPTAFQVDNNTIELTFSEALEINSAQNENNYSLQGFSQNYTLIDAIRQNDWRKVRLTIQEYWAPGDEGEIVVTGVEDLNGNLIGENNTASLLVPSGTTPHTIFVDGTNDFDPDTELIDVGDYSLYITWDNQKLYIGFENLDLNGGGDLFVNLDTDQVYGSGPTGDSWGRVVYPTAYRAEYQVAIEGGGGSIQLNHFADGLWHYPANNNCESYEGWAENGLTEISIPWTSIGNPEGVALSVHVTEEDNQVVTAAFPPENPTGNHPTFTHVYAFFIPYVTSEMPVAGMEPANVITLPNLPPEITGHLPVELSQTVEEGETIGFSVTASDPENDEMMYNWYLDGVLVSSENTYQYLAAFTGEIQEVKVLVNDPVPGHEGDSVVWQVEVLPASGLLADFTADASTLCEGSQVQFSDLSSGEITSWLWTFEGGVPATSTEENPLIGYASAGTFDVSLTVSNAEDSHTLTQTDFITVNGAATVNAGADTVTCENIPILLQGTAENYYSVLWTTSGDGVFSNASSISTNYTPGPSDAVAGFAEITLTAYPHTPCPDAASDMLVLGILAAPQITQQPENITVVVGETAGFSVSADGSTPLDYRWYGPDGLLPEETSTELILENVTAADAGTYYCTVENTCGLVTSEVAVLTVQELMQQVISIPDGWSGISSYLIPEDPMVAQMFSEIVAANGLVVLQNYSFLYWPAEAINTIDVNGGWTPQSGYQLKVNGNQELTITGQTLADKTMTFDEAGWYLLPVLSECGAAPEDLFSGIIDDVMIVKEIAGLKLYWPGVFQNLYTLEPGKAYAAMFTGSVTFTWPECSMAKEAKQLNNPVVPRFNNNAPSPHSHSIVFSAQATQVFSGGDQLEISNERGDVITRIEMHDPGEAIGFQLFGKDFSTGPGRFYAENEPIILKIIREEKSIPLKAGYDERFDSLMWKSNGISLIENLEPGETADHKDIGIWFYPNPAKDRLIISKKNPYSSIGVFSAEGVKVIEKQSETQFLDISSLQPGLYFIYIRNSSGSFVQKFVKH
ncbi:MAG: immunoglobulin domain-containing protein, partial [Bacteroidales bacterium]